MKNYLTLQNKVPIASTSVTEIEVHLSPGSYHTEYAEEDVASGAIYDHSSNVFAFNQMGRNNDDIGHTMSNYVRLNFPEFQPKNILGNIFPKKNIFPGQGFGIGRRTEIPAFRASHIKKRIHIKKIAYI